MVLNDVSLAVVPGERIALTGPSGSGKSTLLNCISGIDRPDAGSIVFDGADLAGLSGDEIALLRRERIGTIFQFFHLLPTLSVFENIAFPLQLLGMAYPQRQLRVQGLLNDVGLEHRPEAMPDQLSGGEMQRVAIARALAIRPRLILADEPTGNLDSVTGEIILDLIERLTNQHCTAMILVTHSVAAARICSRVLRLRDGVISTP